MPIIETKGAASSQGFGQFASTGEAVYIESVFQTWLYTGNGSTQTITNGIDLSTNGGLVWLKARSAAYKNLLQDTARGPTQTLSSNTTDAQAADGYITSFNTSGFSLAQWTAGNGSGDTYASWTFRKQPKFFDVVTYTGDGSGSGRTIPHNLGSQPGMLIIKRTDAASNWWVAATTNGTSFAVGDGTTDFALNLTNAATGSAVAGTSLDSTNFRPFFAARTNNANINGATYVAYLFAHNAGGFGLTGTDNVISCGSFTTNGSAGAAVSLGYEPQWVLIKASSSTSGWLLSDTMRGMSLTNFSWLFPNNSNAESANGYTGVYPTATGFNIQDGTLGASTTYIYIAIRRGPMKTPTSGTSVFSPQYATFSGSTVTDTGFVVDLTISKSGVATSSSNWAIDRLRGAGNSVVSSQQATLQTNDTSADIASSSRVALTGAVTIQNGFLQQTTTANSIVWAFRRAPGFFDEVCYTGNGASTQTITHNLTVSPQLIIAKKRSGSGDWGVYASGQTDGGLLNTADGFNVSNRFAAVGATTFDVKAFGTPSLNDSGATYVAYLFATCPGVSKVGSYTGTGALQTINCGFTGGARFVLIKRTDSTGDWFVYDSARGISSGNDPYLLMNSTAAEVTGTNYVDTASTGFQVTAAAPAGLNASGGTYIFLAIA